MKQQVYLVYYITGDFVDTSWTEVFVTPDEEKAKAYIAKAQRILNARHDYWDDKRESIVQATIDEGRNANAWDWKGYNDEEVELLHHHYMVTVGVQRRYGYQLIEYRP